MQMNLGKRLRARLFAWWYYAIGVGFFLLAINRWLLGERIWLIILRFAIGAGFVLLGYLTWRSQPRRDD